MAGHIDLKVNHNNNKLSDEYVINIIGQYGYCKDEWNDVGAKVEKDANFSDSSKTTNAMH